MNYKIQAGIISAIAITFFSINLLSLNTPEIGLLTFIVLQYIMVLLLFFGKKIGWWLFSIVYGALSILLFIHNFIFKNGGLLNYTMELVITLSVIYLIFNKSLRSAFLKKT
jgi:hypothetical protein